MTLKVNKNPNFEFRIKDFSYKLPISLIFSSQVEKTSLTIFRMGNESLYYNTKNHKSIRYYKKVSLI